MSWLPMPNSSFNYEAARDDWMGNNEYDISNQDAARASIEKWRGKWGAGDANNEVLNLSNGGGLIDLVQGFNSGAPQRRTWTAAGNNGSNPNGAGMGGGGAQPGITGAGGAGGSNPNDSKWNELYDMLSARAKQGIAVNRFDPAVRGQADAYAANEDRARRNYLGDMAEKMGPNANLRGEQRMSAERMGQRVGFNEQDLIGREMMARRQEIATALQQMQGMGTTDKQMQLQRELAALDNAIKQQGLALQGQSINNQNSQFLAQLGFNVDDRKNYWDSIRSGLLTN